MRIVLLGAPGSGKGTQAHVLVDKFGVPHISTGQLLRAEMSSGSTLGKKVSATMDEGGFVSNEIVMEMIENRLRESDTRRGFILDGFPRNIPQAQALDSSLALMGRPLQLALYISVDYGNLLKRLTGRLTCANCGAIYNRHFSKPKKRGICDQCGANKLERRSDDNKKTVQNRLDTFMEETEPLIAYYRAQHKLRTINGEEKVSVIAEKIVDIVNAEIRPLDIKVIDVPVEDVYVTESNTIIAGGAVVKTETGGTIRRKIPTSRTIEKIQETSPEKMTRKRRGRTKAVDKVEAPAKAGETSTGVGEKSETVKEKPTRKSRKKIAKKASTKKKKRPVKKAVGKKKRTSKTVKKKMTRKTTAKKAARKAPVVKKKVKSKRKVTAKKITKKKPIKKKATKKQPKKTAKKTPKKKPVAKAPKRKTTKKKTKRKTTKR